MMRRAQIPDRAEPASRAAFEAELEEPDWRRLPGYRGVTVREWHSVRWQRQHSVRSVPELAAVFGRALTDDLAADIVRDQQRQATMPMLVPPHMINTMREGDLRADPVRRYMVPALSDRDPDWPSHPRAGRDPLAESDMWALEGLVHRYPTKALVELASTCPQYCGHCTRMDLVGPSTPQVTKYSFRMRPRQRFDATLDYLRRTPAIRDVVVSGGDVANVPVRRLTEFVMALMEIPSIRDIRLASKSLIALPQHFLQLEVTAAMELLGRTARDRGVALSLHTHANHVNQITPLVARATAPFRDWGFRDVRNQSVLLRGVNDTPDAILALCRAALDHAAITPYYVYMCDMVPGSEHWRTPLWLAQELQHAIMGSLPGYATPRIVCDVPRSGKLWVHQVDEYDRERGISSWSKRYRTAVERDDPEADQRRYHYYDPIDTLPEAGRAWWWASTLERHAAATR
jgi:lysine 2,3-aminomutase